jgi:tetratricopeptide (TPR) repeat protein
LAKQGFLKSALVGVTSLWNRRGREEVFPDIGSHDPERQGQALFRRGRWRMRAGDLEAALADFDRAIELLPDFADAVVSRAECLDMMGRVETAREDYGRARRLWAEHRTGAADRSYVWRQQGRLSFEVESYELALERIKTGSYPHSAVGNALLARGQPAEALRAYERALKIKPKDPALLALRGEALSMRGRHRQAVASFTLALRSNPRAPETLSGRAVAYAAMGRMGKANADWRRQLALLPERQAAARACVALRLADWSAAIPALERAIEGAPDDPYWRLYRRTALRRLDRPTEDAAVPTDGAWPAPLFALQAGKATPDWVLAAADTPGRRAEALFQLERYEDVVSTASPALIEYAAARNELARR